MNRFLHSIEVMLLLFIAFVCIILDIGDAFNLFNFLPTSYILLALLFLSAVVLGTLASLLNDLSTLSKDIRRAAREDDIAYLQRAYMQVGENLRRVLGDGFFTGLLSPLQIALEEQVVHFREGNQFRLYYASTLKNYASETFLCSTTMKTFSIWLDTSISAANARFIKAGGKIRQIVFIKSGDDVSSVEFQKFVLHQKSIGVEIFIASMSMDTHVLMIELLRKDLFVGTRAPVAWEVFVDDSENIGLSVLIVNPSKIEDYRRVLDLAHQYTPEDAGPAIS